MTRSTRTTIISSMKRQKTATLTKRGVKKAEQFFSLENLTDPDNITIQHHINQAIKAHGIMKRDIDYVVQRRRSYHR